MLWTRLIDKALLSKPLSLWLSKVSRLAGLTISMAAGRLCCSVLNALGVASPSKLLKLLFNRQEKTYQADPTYLYDFLLTYRVFLVRACMLQWLPHAA